MSYVDSDAIDPAFESETGQAGFYFAPVVIAGRYRGAMMQAVEVGYPDNLVELLCEVHLRETLGLVDGDRIEFSLVDDEEPPDRLRTRKNSPS